MTLQESREGWTGGLGGRKERNVAIILDSQMFRNKTQKQTKKFQKKNQKKPRNLQERNFQIHNSTQEAESL